MNTKRRDELRDNLDQTIQRYNEVVANLNEAPAKVSPGDLFLFDVPIEIPLEWGAIFPHPDDRALWYVVPADQNLFVAIEDVEVPEFAKCGPLTLRCGRGLWVHADDFDFQKRSGRLESEYVDQARDKLSQLVSGGLTPSRFQAEVEADIDYQYWLDAVSRAVDVLEQKLQCDDEYAGLEDADELEDAVVLRASDFSLDWHKDLRAPMQAEAPTVLAADSGGLQAVPEASAEPPLGAIVHSNLPGELVALKYEDGLLIQYLPRGDEQPPELHRKEASGAHKRVPWRRTPGGSSICGELLRWDRDSITLLVGSDKGRKMTIEQ